MNNYEIVMRSGKIYGIIRKDLFDKHVERRKHLFRTLTAYGIQEDVLHYLQKKGIRFIKILEKDTGDIYLAALADYLKHGIHVDKGHGPQVMLELKYFEHVNSPQLAMF